VRSLCGVTVLHGCVVTGACGVGGGAMEGCVGSCCAMREDAVCGVSSSSSSVSGRMRAGGGDGAKAGVKTARARAEVGEMSMVHRRGPVRERIPLRMGSPWEFLTVREFRVKMAVQPESQSLPMLIRLWVNPGMMCPVRACAVGSFLRSSSADAVEVCGVPAAVRIVTRGALVLMAETGA